jgi:hypothetical protein
MTRIRRGRVGPEVQPKAAKHPSLKRIGAVVRKAAPPEFTPLASGKLGKKRGEEKN